MKGYQKLEELLNKAVLKAKVLKANGFSHTAIRTTLKKYGADSRTIELIMIAI